MLSLNSKFLLALSLASTLALPSLASAAEPKAQLLSRTENYFDDDYSMDTAEANLLQNGVRRLTITLTNKNQVINLDHLLTKKSAAESACANPGYYVSLQATGNQQINRNARLVISERVRLGHVDDPAHPCALEMVRNYSISVKANGTFSVDAFRLEAIQNDNYFGDYSHSIDYNFVKRKLQIDPSVQYKLPGTCQLTLEELNRSIVATSARNPLGAVKACEPVADVVDMNVKESRALYQELKLSPGRFTDGVYCRASEGEQRNIEPRSSLIEDCHTGSFAQDYEGQELSAKATKAIKHALARTGQELVFIHQDSLGSSNSWGGIRTVSCSSEKSCWFTIDRDYRE